LKRCGWKAVYGDLSISAGFQVPVEEFDRALHGLGERIRNVVVIAFVGIELHRLIYF
jgi:hypothetical protein